MKKQAAYTIEESVLSDFSKIPRIKSKSALVEAWIKDFIEKEKAVVQPTRPSYGFAEQPKEVSP